MRSRFASVTQELEKISLDLCRAVKKCRKCVLEVGCMGKWASLDRECMQFLTAGFFLFFSFFYLGGGEGSSCFTIYVAAWSLFLRLSFFLVGGGGGWGWSGVGVGLPIVHSLQLIDFPFVMYFFPCSLVIWHLIFPCGVRSFSWSDFNEVLFRFRWLTCFSVYVLF